MAYLSIYPNAPLINLSRSLDRRKIIIIMNEFSALDFELFLGLLGRDEGGGKGGFPPPRASPSLSPGGTSFR